MRHAEHEAVRGRAGAPDETVWGLFGARVVGQGGRIAVVDGAVEIDYERLWARAEAIAEALAARGVAPG
ncbi:hypothetical protein, partial [Streptomyces parvus]